jgi:drug/metabolite transporter (DMT)-like permease
MRQPASFPRSTPRARTVSRTPNSVRRRDLVRVVLWMTGALLSFSAMAVSIRALSGTLRIMEILAIRNGGGLAILLALGAFNPAHIRALSARRMALHLTRNTIHFGAQFLWAKGLTLLPLATVFALEFTMPAYTALLAAIFLNERLTPSRIGVVIFGFVGVLVILRPGLETFRPAAFLVLGAAFGYAASLTQTKALTSTETTFAILLWMNVVQLPLAMLGSDPRSYFGLGAADLMPIGAVALSGLASHFCLAQAFRYGDAGLVVPLDFMRIPLIALVGWWLYGEALDASVFAGAGLIVLGVLWNLRAEAVRKTGITK